MFKTDNQKALAAFKKEHNIFKKLSPYEQKKAYEIIKKLGLNKPPTTGHDLAWMIDMSPADMRALITKIRREMTAFQNPTGKIALIATGEGYKLSDQQAEIKGYRNELYIRWVSINLQLMEANIILENIEKETKNA